MKYVALLRGVNVGGNTVMSMSGLRKEFEATGCTNVKTYIQSGNVVFDASGSSLRSLQGLTRFRMVTRTGREFLEIVAKNPFDEPDATKLHIAFLSEAAPPGLECSDFPPDRLISDGREIYLHLPNGMGRSKLAGSYLTSKLKHLTMTVRNWRTVTKLAEML